MTRDAASEGGVARRAALAFASSDVVRIGAEVEWLVYDRNDPSCAVSAATVADVAAGPLPAGGAITVEPGGQLELATQPRSGPRQLVDALEADASTLAHRFAQHDLALVALGLDPIRSAHRSLDTPRYRAMEQYFAEVSPTGLRMMCLTASLQLNIDFGSNPALTWRHAHAIAPLLAATFANSPTTNGSDPQPVSHRQRVWAATDPCRTRLVGPATHDWLAYVLDASAMLRDGPDGIEAALPRRSFRRWLGTSAPPTPQELELHLTTLFPALRPRGYLEIRMIDAIPALGRAAAIATVWALLTDHTRGTAAVEACGSLEDPWTAVLDEGLANAELRAAAASVLDIAAGSVRRSDHDLGRACDAWRERVMSAEVGVAGCPTALAEPTSRFDAANTMRLRPA